ncbi:hypothetical protein [Flagellimonas sp.]|uniref:hypothetical protein n=1 Tax=Flagellimonas sp. TaxID=2058762 RepID=UPI003F49D21B
MKSRAIVFFTTPEKLKVVLQTRRLRLLLDEENMVKIGVDNCDNCFLYLVHDNSSIDLDSIAHNTLGIYIYHNETNSILKQKLDDNGFIGFKDHHVPRGSTISEGYYLWLNEIKGTLREVSNINNKQFESFWNHFDDSYGVKDALNILNTIYSGKPITKDFINTYSRRLNTISEKGIDKNMLKFIKHLQQENYKYDDSQQPLLSSLRDLLLSDIQIK